MAVGVSVEEICKPSGDKKTLALSARVLVDLLEAVLGKGCLFRFCAHGGSMMPFVRDGDTLTIAPLGDRPPRLGEVVAFSCPTEEGIRLVIHRIVGRRRNGFVVRGDAEGCIPEIVSPENILGRLVKVQRDGRHVRLGLGPERILIAWLGRARLLWISILPSWHEFFLLYKGRTYR